MSLDRLFDSIEKARQAADVRAAFGPPQATEGKTIIPVAQVGYGFGLGFGSGSAPAEPEEATETSTGEGGGGGGGGSAKPLGVVVVTGDDVHFEPIQDEGRIALAGMAAGVLFIWQVARTLRAVLGR